MKMIVALKFPSQLFILPFVLSLEVWYLFGFSTTVKILEFLF